MMKKNRTIYFLLALVCLGLQSCLFQEEDYFDDSSANRATADVKRCSELLEAAPNGWVMEYYVGKDYSLGGITLLCKFDGQRVTMASQIAGADETVSSLYSVKSEQATMLSFDTYNYLVHYFGQPQGSMADDPNARRRLRIRDLRCHRRPYRTERQEIWQPHRDEGFFCRPDVEAISHPDKESGRRCFLL